MLGTGDFTHPGWISELEEKLVEAEDGLYRLRPDIQKKVDGQALLPGFRPTRFLLSSEISCIYKKNGKTRKAHHLILMPDMASAHKLNERLDRIGNISSDGRPILGLDSRDLLEITLETDDRAFFIPAHIWTPWFSVFGSKSGFDSLEECFGDLTGYIHALETGLSTDPPMNRCISALDKYILVSNSDAHSPSKLGREANLFDTDLDYNQMISAMSDGNGFAGTVEFFPEEGKYHLDGHRKCRVRLTPAETKQYDGVCPVCGKPVTVGVLNRIYDLADRDAPELSKDFFSLIPLCEVLSELLSCGPATKKVTGFYEKLLMELGPELQILLDVPLSDLDKAGGFLLAEGIDRMRRGQVIKQEGYDGEYGIIRLFDEAEKPALSGQMALFAQKTPKTSSPPGRSLIRKKGSKKTEEQEKRTESKGTDRVLQTDPILDPLNREQESAVLHQDGNLLVVAGPGTGKTMTLAHRIAYLIRTGLAAPEQVLALTFTRKAAGEMRRRINGLLEGLNSNQVSVATFHGFCMDLLRSEGRKTGIPHDFTLCSEWDAKDLAREILKESGTAKRSAGRLLKAIPAIKTASVLNSGESGFDNELLALFNKYQARLRELDMLDLDDLEVEALRLLRDHVDISRAYGSKFAWIFVDEYQDTNPVQVETLKTLIHAAGGTICAIGDPDQAIYGFRGADLGNFYRFPEDFPKAKQVTLTHNYRSTNYLLQASAALMEKPKPLEGESSGGIPISIASCRTDSEEAEMIVEQVERLIGGTSHFSIDSGRVASHEGEMSLGLDDIGILYRLNAQGDAIEKAFDRAGIPVVRSGETALIGRYPVNILWRLFQTLTYPDNTYYARKYEMLVQDRGLMRKEIIAFFHGSRSLPELIDQAVSFLELDCSSEDSAKALGRLKQVAVDFKGDMAMFLDTLSLERGIDHGGLEGDRVALMSLHAAKGLQWPVVFISGCEDRLMPCSLFRGTDREEERRLLYVGMTRARSRLILSYVNRRSLNGRVLHMKPSPFLEAIPGNLCIPLERGRWKGKKRQHKQLKLF